VPTDATRLSEPAIRPDVTCSIGITTRNRPDSLVRCVASLASFGDLVREIIIVDDSSDVPVEPAFDRLPPALRQKIVFIPQTGHRGYIVARNAIMRRATSEYVLLLDDDTCVMNPEPIRSALELIDASPNVAAVACAQAEADGTPWPASMQPSPVSYACYVPTFIGFAHLLRRRVFLDLGGYRESFHFYGEEKDYCLRVTNASYDIVYVPDALVAHLPDPSGRSETRFLRYVIRNDCFCALYNEPFPMPVVTVPMRLIRYVSMRRHGGVNDSGGLRWIVGELLRMAPGVLRDRTPLRWTTIRRWRRLRRSWPAFERDLKWSIAQR